MWSKNTKVSYFHVSIPITHPFQGLKKLFSSYVVGVFPGSQYSSFIPVQLISVSIVSLND